MTEGLLRLVGPIHVAGGLLLFASGFVPSLSRLLQNLIPASEQFVWSTFFAAVLGPTIASWGVLFEALVNQFYRSPADTTWRAMLFAVLIWAPLDSALCLYYGLYGGVAINVVVFVTLCILLLSARRQLR